VSRAATLVVGALVVTALAMGVQTLLDRHKHARQHRVILPAGDVLPAGDADVRPNPAELPEPRWPAGETPAGAESTVVVAMVIDTSGAVMGASLVQGTGNDALDDAALHAAMAARFTPAKRNGQPVQVKVYIAYDYRR
jgi:protein TonB